LRKGVKGKQVWKKVNNKNETDIMCAGTLLTAGRSFNFIDGDPAGRIVFLQLKTPLTFKDRPLLERSLLEMFLLAMSRSKNF
jgi:hypothetical protein